jgi:hypothetical protein
MKIGFLFLLIAITWCTANQVTNTVNVLVEEKKNE